MFRKRSKAHQHILYISQYIERRNLIAIFGGWVGVGVVVVVVVVVVVGGGGGGGGVGGGGHLRGLYFVEAIYPFLFEKKIRIQNSVERIWVTVIQVLFLKRIQLSDEYVS